MNKKRVDDYLEKAAIALEATGIVEQNEHGVKSIQKTYRGQISTFGASVSMGSILSAVACFSGKGAATVDRVKLMAAIWVLLKGDYNADKKLKIGEYVINGEALGELAAKCQYYALELFNEVKTVGANQRVALKNSIIECAVALKLAMNLYKLEK